MKTITLTRGFVTKVDDKDFEVYGKYKWCASVTKNGSRAQAVRKSDGEYLYLHREIMGCPKGLVVDHVNHDPLDNRKENLRICLNSENIRNRKGAQKNSLTGVRGVQHRNGSYSARVGTKHLGTFKTIEEAIAVHNKAAVEAYGDFAGVK